MIKIERDKQGRHFIDSNFVCAEDFDTKLYRKKTLLTAVQMEEVFSVQTLEGEMVGKSGDWLAIGYKGEMYPIDNEIFELTYEIA